MSVIIVDNELIDSVKEYALIIDTVQENNGFSDSLLPYFNETNQEVVKGEDLANKIFKESLVDILVKLSDKEFEPTFNLLIYILLQLNQSLDSELVDKLVKCNPEVQPTLRDRKSIKTSSILSLLSNIFNLVPETSQLKIYVLSQILAVSEKSPIGYSLIQSTFGENLVNWLEKAGASNEQIKDLFWNFIRLDNKYSLKSLQLIKSFVSAYPLIDLDLLIKFALSSEIVDVSFLVNNNLATALKENESNELVVLFNKYIRGEKITSVPVGLPENLIISKSKVLVLARFFVDNDGKNVFKYSEVPLAESPQEFEELLVNAIKAGVVEGKLNQVEQSFYLTRVSRFIVAGDSNANEKSWEAVKKVLVDWKESISNIDEIVNTSRENIVSNSSN